MAHALSTLRAPPSAFFTKIPAELRNNIYELAFTQTSPDAEIDVAQAQPPTKALLLTSRRFNTEAKGFYKDAYRKYWRSNNFFVKFREAGLISAAMGPEDPLAGVRDVDLENITSLSIKMVSKDGVFLLYTLADPRGGWSVMGDDVYDVAVRERNGRWDFAFVSSSEEMKRRLDGNVVPIARRAQIQEHIIRGDGGILNSLGV
ncbi:hypothetical protein PRZ48_012187 [Zasmidium cellare]|uniref:F-box domain-containing protein n=1 Tax=Zasmidium cellare TaxID=395010 RepID=A0ABR0E484_ZASCE|nr:hypothetical protein PRZ48_012187 [Zasmidium cellare]